MSLPHTEPSLFTLSLGPFYSRIILFTFFKNVQFQRAGTCVSHSLRHPWQIAQAWHGGGSSNYLPSDWSRNYPVPVSPTCCPPAKLALSLWLLGPTCKPEHKHSGLAGPLPPYRKAPLLLWTMGNTQFYKISDSLISCPRGHTKCFVKLTALQEWSKRCPG